MRNIYILITFFLCSLSYGQVGINTFSPADGTALDINENDKGLLIPRVSLSASNSLTGITLMGSSLEEGVLVFNTNVVTGSNPLNKGFYFWNGTNQWIALGNDTDWSEGGNTIIAASRLGTNNNLPLIIKTGNTDRFRFETNGTLRSIARGNENSPAFSFLDNTRSGMYLASNTTDLTLTSNGHDFLTLKEFGSSRQITMNPDNDGDMNFQVRGTGGVVISANPARNNVQIGANTNPDYASLSLSHNNKGFLPNRLNIADLSTFAPLVSDPLDGLIAYNSRTSSGTQGLYIWESRWKKLYTNSESLVPQSSSFNIGSTTNRYSTIFLANNPDVSSDRRLKDNITDVSLGLNEVLAMRPVNYSLKADETKNMLTGFIAQEMMELVPNVVETDENGMLSMRYAELIPILTKAIQEQQTVIENQNQSIKTLEQRLAKLEALIKN